MKNIIDIINQNSLNNISNNVRSYIIIESILRNTFIIQNESLLLEGSGLYKGCYDLAKYINNKIFNSLENKVIINTTNLSFTNIFTKEIIINIDRKSNEEYASYIFANSIDKNYNERRWSKEDNKFNFIELNVYFNKSTTNIIDLLIHELDHAYDDYKQYENNGNTYQYKYIKSNYSMFVKTKHDDEFTQLVKAINYIFIKFETHAYIVQIRGEINKKFANLSDAFDFLENKSRIWNQLKIVKNNVECILQNNKLSNKYCETFRNITNSNKTNEHILKELEYKKDKYWNKIINHIYLLLLDNSIQENNLTTCPSSRKIILNNLNSFINH